jgi:hypothetical protein
VGRQEIERALARWREAERALADADGDAKQLQAEVDRARVAFQELSAEHMAQQIDSLKAAEQRRASAPASSAPYHEAAREETKIARELWQDARLADGGTPRPSE